MLTQNLSSADFILWPQFCCIFGPLHERPKSPIGRADDALQRSRALPVRFRDKGNCVSGIPFEFDDAEGSPEGEFVIPLEESDGTASQIVPTKSSLDGADIVRGRRKDARKAFEGIWVLFEPDARANGTEQVECPLVDISVTGFAVLYDRPLKSGVKGYVSYRSQCDKPVRISFTVKRTIPQSGGRYLIGCQMDKKLNVEDRRPARVRPGRSVVAGIRARRIKLPGLSGSDNSIPRIDLAPMPHVLTPGSDAQEEIPLAGE